VAGLELAAVVTRDPARRAQAAEDHPDAVLLDDAEAVWARAAELDLVVVATPNRHHLPLARAALEHDLHVVVDKPLAPTAAEARSLVELGRARARVLTVFHNRRWDGDLLTLERLLADDALGRVLRFESRFERWRPEIKQGWRELGDPAEGGGVLADLGSHLADQALHLFGPARHVYAELHARRPGAQVDDDAFVALEHAGGVRSHLWMSSVAADRGPRLRVLGERAAYVKHGMDVQEAALRAGARPGDDGWGEEPESASGRLVAGDSAEPVPTERGAYQRFYEGVVAAVRDGAPPPVDPSEAIAVVEVLDAARTSARERRVVTP
jgi:predicted dehydrogenase